MHILCIYIIYSTPVHLYWRRLVYVKKGITGTLVLPRKCDRCSTSILVGIKWVSMNSSVLYQPNRSGTLSQKWVTWRWFLYLCVGYTISRWWYFHFPYITTVALAIGFWQKPISGHQIRNECDNLLSVLSGTFVNRKSTRYMYIVLDCTWCIIQVLVHTHTSEREDAISFSVSSPFIENVASC
jgi:hypothetical protein